MENETQKQSRSLKVLYVDDDEDDFLLVRSLLLEARNARFELDWAGTFEDALFNLESDRHDVILLDHHLGVHNGLEVARYALDRGCQAPVILLTGYGSDELDLKAIQFGIADYLTKDMLTVPLLERSIRYAIERKRAEEALRQSQAELEIQVRERTQELAEAIEELRVEVAVRQRGEEAIKQKSASIQLLRDIAVAANEAVNVDEMFRFALERICLFTGWSLGHVYWIDPITPDNLVPTDLWYFQDPQKYDQFRKTTRESSLKKGIGLPGKSLENRETVWANNVTEMLVPNRAIEATSLQLQTALAFPVLVGPEICAVLEFFSEELIAPDEQILDVMAQVGAQLGRVVERQRSRDQLTQQSERTKALAQLSQALAEVETDHQQVLETIATRVADLIGDACVVTLMSEDGKWLNPVGFHHPDPEAAEMLNYLLSSKPYPADQGLAGGVFQTGNAILIPVVPLDPDQPFFREEYRPYNERFRIQSVLIVPLRAQGKPIGTIGVTRNKPGKPYTNEDQIFLQELADRAALAIVNAQLLHALQDELVERQRAEETLRKSEARFRTIFNESAIGIELFDLEGRIQASNPAYQEMLGYTEEELGQMRFVDVIDPVDTQENETRFKELLEGERTHYQREERYRHKDGQLVWVYQSISLVQDERELPQFAICLVENITERKRMEGELAELQLRLMDSVEIERLQLAQKLHDDAIQALFGITFQLEGIQDSFIDEESRGQLNLAKNELRQVIHLLRRTYKDLRPPALVPFGLDKAIASHAENFQLDHPELTIRLDLLPNLKELPERVGYTLFRIYQHAMNNVASHAGASLVNIRLISDRGKMVLEIQDNGLGFTAPKSWIELVRKGHYGLARAMERAKAIGGTLQVESQPDRGSLIRVIIPPGHP